MIYLEPREHLDKCIVGIVYGEERLIYDTESVLETFMETNNWEYEEALEWFEYNTIRALPYMGENAPIFLSKELDI